MLEFQKGEEIVFVVRSTATGAPKPDGAKDPEPGAIPRKFSITITKTYVDEDGQPLEILEDTLVFFVNTPPPKEIWAAMICRGRTTKGSRKYIET